MRWKKNQQEAQRRQPARTNSGSDRTFAYYKTQRKKPNEKHLEIKDTDHSKLRLVPSIIAVTVILGSLFYATTLSTDPSVRLVANQEPIYHTVEEYQDYSARIMSMDTLNLTKFTVNTSKIEEEMLKAFPELDGVAVSLPVLGRRPTITLSARQPALLLTNSANLYVLDSNGRVISLAKDLDAKTLSGLKTIQDESGVKIDIGKQAVTSDTVNFIDIVSRQLADKNLSIQSLSLPLAANVLNVQVDGEKYYVKMDIGGNARLQTGSYLAVRGELSRQGITPKDYIDVRVEEKVFYK